jgi:hypothetical protein
MPGPADNRRGFLCSIWQRERASQRTL